MDINFFDPSVINDPYPLYEEIRATGRVVWNQALQTWMVPGFDDCRTVLTDHHVYTNAHYRDPEKVWWFEARNMVQVEPPEHDRLRAPLAPMFARSAVARLEDTVADIVDELLDPLVGNAGGFDIIQDFTMIPTVVLARMIGVPATRQEDFRRWSKTIAGSLAYGHEDPAALQAMHAASDEMKQYLIEELDRHRRDQPDDLLTEMLRLAGDGTMSDAEIRSAISVLLLAGYDTTAKLMANALVVLARCADERRLLVDEPSLIPQAIEEILRWCGVLHGVIRTVERDTELGGVPITAGQFVCTLPAAANRDPGRWSDPLRFDIKREAKAHLGFGYGPHLCIGAPLARLETRVALERLLKRAPDYSLSDLDYGHAWFIRGPQKGLFRIGSAAPV